MSISSRILSMINHTKESYDSLDYLGEDIITINKNIQNISNLLENVYNNYPKVFSTGTDVILNNAKASKMKIDIKGDIFQTNYTGIQLLKNVRSDSKTVNGITFTVNEDKSITIDGTATANADFPLISDTYASNLISFPAGTYTKCIVNKNKETVQGISFHTRKNNEAGSDFSSGLRFGVGTLSSQTNIYVRIRVSNGYTFNKLTMYPMIISGEYNLETIPDYEPYTGRKLCSNNR